jgi:hypothetical protein
MLKRLMVRNTDQSHEQSIELKNNIVIEVHTCSYRALRGYALLCCICDEISFWKSDEFAANPDKEVITAVRGGLANPGFTGMLLCISSPYSRKGMLWEMFKRHFGEDGSKVMIWHGESLDMNPLLPPEVVLRALQEDEHAARAEYFAEFRSDLESFIDVEHVRSLVIPGRRELPYRSGIRYRGFVDASGGSGRDSYTMAITHMEAMGGQAIGVLDLVREVAPPFSPVHVTREFAETFKSYGIHYVYGDRFAGGWPGEQFNINGVGYGVCAQTKSQLYAETLPLLNSRQIELLDHPRLISQLCNLEMRTTRGTSPIIDHPPNGHDDVINAAAGAFIALKHHKKPERQQAW